MRYREEENASLQHKEAYRDGLERLILRRQKEAETERLAYAKDIFTDPERYRREFKAMLGWPLTEEKPDLPPKAECKKLGEEEGYCIYSMEFEILEGLTLHGLLFRQNTEEPRPLVLLQHGGLGTPEYLAGFYEYKGYYNDMLETVMSLGVHAFAPQLLLWQKDRFGAEYDRQAIDARLKRLGSSVTAVELYGIMRILDYFEAARWVGNFGMIGLSYGGFYTLFAAAVDPRIKSSFSCSFFNTRDAHPWLDWTWFSAAYRFDDAEIACLSYPRRLCLAVGKKDELFDYRGGLASFEKLKALCREVGTDWVEIVAHEGGHEFYCDREIIRRLVEDIR